MADQVDHRALGIELFNSTWTLMDLPVRTTEQDDAMLHMAHASAHHWRRPGTGATPENLATSEWQVSRVYTVLGRGEPAVHHARRCLDLCRENAIDGWLLASAYEALARSWAVSGDLDAARTWADLGHATAATVPDDDDRAVVLGDLASIPGLTG